MDKTAGQTRIDGYTQERASKTYYHKPGMIGLLAPVLEPL